MLLQSLILLTQSGMSKAEESSSKAVLRALSMLEAVAHRQGGLTLSELSRKLEIPKSTASYILHTLQTKGYLIRDKDTGKYRLGLKLLNLSHSVQTNLDLRELILPLLQHFVDRAKLSAHLAILDRGRAVYIEKIEAPGFVKMDTWVGKRVPVHTTAVGKALVSQMTEEEIEHILKERGMDRVTSKTITSRTKFLHEIEKVREQGYAIDDEENSDGVRCVAAPIYNAGGLVIAAVGTSGTLSMIDDAHLIKTIEMIKEIARRVSNQLGHHTRTHR